MPMIDKVFEWLFAAILASARAKNDPPVLSKNDPGGL
jgi:hypothetical protein